MKKQTVQAMLSAVLVILGSSPALASGGAACASGATENTGITATTPTSRFMDNNDGTVTDTLTGLMWKQCSEGQTGVDCSAGAIVLFGWQSALSQAKVSSFAGYNDWRLPNVKELATIVEYRCGLPAINAAVFPVPSPTSVTYYWSSSPNQWNPEYGAKAWYVSFLAGNVSFGGKADDHNVRLVRAGQ